MEALNAASLTPLSVLRDRRKEPRKTSSLPTAAALKFPSSVACSKTPSNLQEHLSRSLQGGLVILSSALSSGFAKALTYDEALQESVSSPTSDFDSNGVLDGVINFVTENPTVIAGGAVVLAVPLVLSQLLKKPKPWGVESARKAYNRLGEDATAQLLDIRAPKEFREVGSPDVKGLGKKAVSVVYNGEDKTGFLKKLSLKFKEPENTTLFILDKFDGNSELVAELVTVNGFKAAYAIKDGAEGPRGWLNSGLPWAAPKKAFSLNLGNLTEAINEVLRGGSDGLPVTLGLAAATGLGFLAFSEIETILQLLGSAAAIQLVSKKFLYAEDRKQTLKQINEFLNTKIAPKELVDEIKQIGKAFLPSSSTSRSLPPPPAEAKQESATVQKAEAAPPLTQEPKMEAAPESSPQINSVPKTDVKADALTGFSRPLSPYASYPDLKPPTSPTPSQP